MKYPVIKTISIATLAAAVAACGGSGGGSDSSSTGTASLDLTDAPTDQFSEVVITFTGVTMQPADGEAVVFNFDTPKTLDLLTLQGAQPLRC